MGSGFDRNIVPRSKPNNSRVEGVGGDIGARRNSATGIFPISGIGAASTSDCEKRLCHTISTVTCKKTWNRKTQCHSRYDCTTPGRVVSDDRPHARFLYVYCDLLQAVPVGDVKAPLLRIANKPDKVESVNLHRSMRRMMYLPVQKKIFRHDRDTDIG